MSTIRNPILEISGVPIQFIGDPHLGKKFKAGVPLHRLGEYEALQMATFNELIMSASAEVIICVGDLFDRRVISNELLLETYNTIMRATRPVYILKGNHDLSRDATLRSSFDVLKQLTRSNPNIKLIDDVMSVNLNNKAHVGFLPYDAYLTSDQMLARFKEKYPQQKFNLIVGHWDDKSYGNDQAHNIIPLGGLLEITDRVISGHIHSEDNAVFINSMLPYGFNEDPREEYYVTRTLEEVLANPEAYLNKKVRVKIRKGLESLPEGLDCLAMVPQYLSEDGKEIDDDISVNIMDFSLDKLILSSLLEAGVDDVEITEEVMSIYNYNKEEATQC